MMTRGNKGNPYSPQSRKPLHCDRSGVDESSSPQSHQNLNHGTQHEVTVDEPSYLGNNDDSTNIREVSIKDVSDLESLIRDGKPRQYYSTPECARSSSKPAARKEERQKAGIYACMMNIRMLSCIAVVVVAVMVGIYIHSRNLYGAQDYAEKVEREKYLRMDIQHIHDEFPSQLNTTWQAFSAGIKVVLETPTKPSVFLLLHETEGGTTACLAWKIGNISAHFLSATNPNPVVLDGANIEKNQTLAEDYGILLEEYRPMVEERRTMIVKDLHKIPGIVAQSFHWFCDTVTPLVDKAIYLFTLKASGVSHAQDNPTGVAEKELRKLWNGQLDEDKLMPLIVRITHSVMVIMPEKHQISCPDGAIVAEREHL